ncbi:MAG: Na+/H+ antiporter subunit E [bacterium]|nr:Na+/H+ antiporter subunit E [bacterium]
MQFFTIFAILFGFWIILSGKFDAFHLVLGLISTLIVTKWSGDLLFSSNKTFSQRLRFSVRFWNYWLWLNWQVVLANIQVLLLAFHPNLDDVLDPQIVEFDTTIKDEFGQFILANSITLTPGTITISNNNGRFRVHAITKEAAGGVPGDMQDKVARVIS